MSNSTVFTTCGGQISTTGICNRCGQPAVITGNSCGRLIQVLPESIDPLTAYKKALRERIEVEFSQMIITLMLEVHEEAFNRGELPTPPTHEDSELYLRMKHRIVKNLLDTVK